MGALLIAVARLTVSLAAAEPDVVVVPEPVVEAPPDDGLDMVGRAVVATPRWRTGRLIAWTGLGAAALGPPLLFKGATLGRHHIGDPLGPSLFVLGLAGTLYGLSAMPVGTGVQNGALRQEGLPTNAAFSWMAAAGATTVVLTRLVPVPGDANRVALAGFGVLGAGFVLQHIENRRVLNGELSIWDAELRPWSDGRHHGASLSVGW